MNCRLVLKYVFLFLILAAVSAFAETYSWEDGNGVHFTENIKSVPLKYREKAAASVREDITTRNPAVKESVEKSKRINAFRERNEQQEAKMRQVQENYNNAMKKRREEIEAEQRKLRDPKRDYDNWRPSNHRQGYSKAPVRRRADSPLYQ